MNERLLTLALAVLGLGVALSGVAVAKEKQPVKDRVWVILGGGMSALILCLALFLPGVLNNYWAINVAVAQPDVDQRLAVPREDPRGDGTPVETDTGVNAAAEAIRHDELLVSVESARASSLPDKGPTSYALVHLEFANVGGGLIAFKGFDKSNHQPVLSDTSGHAYAFVEQRQRLRARGAPVFDAPKAGGTELSATSSQGYLLVFELPSGGLNSLKLEIPASAWGRQGVYQFQIPGPF
jgi:hypothetical protein